MSEYGELGVGDLGSSAKGSGARFNADKAPFDLMLLKDFPVIGEIDDGYELLHDVFGSLADFQIEGCVLDLELAIARLYQYSVTQDSYGKEGHAYALEPVARVLQHGAKKYAAWNWAKGMPWSVPLGCAVRHYLQIVEHGQVNDKESGLPHWAHIYCNVAMLKWFFEYYPDGNDLPFSILDFENEKRNSDFENEKRNSDFENEKSDWRWFLDNLDKVKFSSNPLNIPYSDTESDKDDPSWDKVTMTKLWVDGEDEAGGYPVVVPEKPEYTLVVFNTDTHDLRKEHYKAGGIISLPENETLIHVY